MSIAMLAPAMTVGTTQVTTVVAVSGTTATTPIPFRFEAGADLVVHTRATGGAWTPKTLNVHYTVSGGATDAGGTLTWTPALTFAGDVRIRRRSSSAQGARLRDGDRFPSLSVERALDRLTLRTQEALDGVDRAFTVPAGELGLEWPDAVSRANKFAFFDATGQPKPISYAEATATATMTLVAAYTVAGANIEVVFFPETNQLRFAATGLALAGHGHANATQLIAGFMSTADKIKLDGIPFGGLNPALSDNAPAALGAAAASGAANQASRGDHVHPFPTAANVGADPTGTAANAIAVHLAAGNPHAQYLLTDNTLLALATFAAVPNKYATLNAAVAALASGGGLIVVHGVTTLSASLTVPANIGILCVDGAQITKASTYTLTINGSFQAPKTSKVFFDFAAGDVIFGPSATPESWAEWWGAGPSATNEANRLAFMSSMLASLGTSVNMVGPNTYTLNLAGNAGAQNSGNGAAIVMNTSNNPLAKAIVWRAAVRGKSRLKIGNALVANVMEAVHTAGSGVTDFPVAIENGLILDGNGANQTQTVPGLYGGDRYGCGFYGERCRGMVFDVETTAASFHGFQLNACHKSRGRAWSHHNYDNGALLTGNPSGVPTPTWGEENDLDLLVNDNGIDQASQDDTFFCGAIVLCQKNSRFRVISKNHSVSKTAASSPNARLNASGLLFNRCYDVGFDVWSSGDRQGVTHDGVANNVKVRGAIVDSVRVGLHLENNAASKSAGLDFDVDIRGAPLLADLGQNSTVDIEACGFRGAWVNKSGAAGELISIGSRLKNYRMAMHSVGDQAGAANVNSIAKFYSAAGSGVWSSMRILGTMLVSPFQSMPTGEHVVDVEGYAPALQTAQAAGASTYTFGPYNHDTVFSVAAVNGMTGLSVGYPGFATNRQSTLNSEIFVPRGHRVFVSWATTAPTFDILHAAPR